MDGSHDFRASHANRRRSRQAKRSLRRERREHRIQAIDRAVLETPGADLGEIDTVEPLDGQHVPGIVEILPPPPAKFLHDEIFRPGEPCRPA